MFYSVPSPSAELLKGKMFGPLKALSKSCRTFRFEFINAFTTYRQLSEFAGRHFANVSGKRDGNDIALISVRCAERELVRERERERET